jgi:hypothetical protein
MSTEQLDAIQARAEAASEGPWDFGTGYSADGARELTEKVEKSAFLTLSLNDGGRPLSVIDNGTIIPAVTGDGPNAKANAEFIAHARTDIPALVALVRVQAAKLDAILALANANGRAGWLVTPTEIRETLGETA